MTSSAHNLSHVCSPRYPTPSSIVVSNDALLPVTGTGSATLSRFLRLNNVLVSPHIIKNLISVRQFTTDNNCSVEFNPAGCSKLGKRSSGAIAPGRCTPCTPL